MTHRFPINVRRAVPHLSFVLVCVLLAGIAFASQGNLLIVLPRATGPYAEALEQIVRGIRDAYEGEVATTLISRASDQDIAQLARLLDNGDRPQRLIALGPLALEAINRITENLERYPPIATYATAVKAFAPLRDSTTLSFVLDPRVIIGWTKRARPSTSKIVVFYPASSEPLTPEFEAAARQAGVAITLRVVRDAADALLKVRSTVSELDPQASAVWFVNGALSLNPELLIEQVLKESWQSGIAVFSDNPAHVQRGFLMALYPDYYQAGRDLVEITARREAGDRRRLFYTRSVSMALNVRTARHLRMGNLDEVKNSASALFPIK